MPPKDNFSKQSDLYAKYRTWDCATGNGQVAHKLAESFDRVIATDISQNQLDKATPHPKISYTIGSAENISIPDRSIDLVTVGQAIHWFDHTAFYKEVKRVSKPNALLAYWSYGPLQVSPDINQAIYDFHYGILGSYWDPERKIWANEYRDIEFPLKNFDRKNFEYRIQWDIGHLEGYLNSWSAVQHYIKQVGENPVPSLIASISTMWNKEMTVRFPIFLYAGLVH